MENSVEFAVRQVVALLASGDYSGLEALTRGVRLNASQIEQAITDYGRSVVLPPDDGYELIEAIEVITAPRGTWSVTVPLWTAEEGRSDLTAELTVLIAAEGVTVELDNLHVA